MDSRAASAKAPAREPFFSRRIAVAVVTAIGSMYLLQVVTPLRLDDDALDYLRTAAAITDGRPIPVLPIPAGYSVIVSFIERLGVGSSGFFVLANCVFLALGLLALWKLDVYSESVRLFAMAATLLTIPVIKSVAIALPDAAFFGLSLAAISLMASATRKGGNRRLVALAAAGSITIAAITIRYAGIALIAPLLFSFFRQDVGPGSSRGRAQLVGEIMLALVLSAGLVAVLAGTRVFSMYVGQASDYYANASIFSRVLHRTAVTMKTLGELVLNLPLSRFRAWGVAFAAAGAVFCVLGASLIRAPLRLTVPRVFLIAYCLLLIAWPNPTTRLWIPAIPFLFCEVAQALISAPRMQRFRLASVAYTTWLALTGMAALAYTTRISWSGDRFPHLYGKAGGMADPSIKPGDKSWSRAQFYNAEAVKLFRRYGRR